MADAPEKAAKPSGVVRLSDAADFKLGRLNVRPSFGTVSDSDQIEKLEPRIMQVLVALADCDGATVSRDNLIERCWDGVVVGDDAIYRAIRASGV